MKLSDALSIVAIVISVLAVTFEYCYTVHINRNSLMSSYYSDTFKKYLTKLIPNARKGIFYNRQDKFLTGTEQLEDVILDMRQESLYFRYQNVDFYNGLKTILNNIDDLLVENGGHRLTGSAFVKFERELDCAIAKMYQLINDNYVGRK